MGKTIATGEIALASDVLALLDAAFSEIEEILLVGSVGSVEFANIPSGYAAFLLIWHDVYGDNNLTAWLNLTFNSDGGNNYDYSTKLFSENSSTTHAAAFCFIGECGDVDGSEFHGSGRITVLNRASQEKNYWGTSLIVTKAGGNAEDTMEYHLAGKWRNVADEIDTITITPSVGNFVAGSRFILLGIKT